MDRNAIPVEWLKRQVSTASREEIIATWQRKCDEKDERDRDVQALIAWHVDDAPKGGVNYPYMRALLDKLRALGWVKYTVGVDTGTGTSKSVVHAVVSARIAAPQPTDETLAKELYRAFCAATRTGGSWEGISADCKKGYLAEASYVRRLIRRAERDGKLAVHNELCCRVGCRDPNNCAVTKSIRAEYADVED